MRCWRSMLQTKKTQITAESACFRHFNIKKKSASLGRSPFPVKERFVRSWSRYIWSISRSESQMGPESTQIWWSSETWFHSRRTAAKVRDRYYRNSGKRRKTVCFSDFWLLRSAASEPGNGGSYACRTVLWNAETCEFAIPGNSSCRAWTVREEDAW